jgi:hypothetical protein
LQKEAFLGGKEVDSIKRIIGFWVINQTNKMNRSLHDPGNGSRKVPAKDLLPKVRDNVKTK